MIETVLTAIATAVTTVIIPKAIETMGDKLGESAFDHGGKIIKTITFVGVQGLNPKNLFYRNNRFCE